MCPYGFIINGKFSIIETLNKFTRLNRPKVKHNPSHITS